MILDKDLNPNFTLKVNWIHEYPTEPGFYWFYGVRYGYPKDIISEKNELLLCYCAKISNGTMLVGDGQFMHRSEFGKNWFFAKADLPILPNNN